VKPTRDPYTQALIDRLIGLNAKQDSILKRIVKENDYALVQEFDDVDAEIQNVFESLRGLGYTVDTKMP
jgi:hypothetical protein